jgi:hypothetical protein
MNYILSVVLFVVIVLLYLNIVEQTHRGIELEMYEIDYENIYSLQKIVKKRQPVLFQMKGVVVADNHYLHTLHLDAFSKKYGKEKVMISNMSEPSSVVKPIAIPLNRALELVNTEKEVPFLSHQNGNLIRETSLRRYMSTLDEYIKPSFNIATKNDILFGSAGAATPLSYHSYQCGYVYVAQGTATIKMTPQKMLNEGGKAVTKEDMTFLYSKNIWKEEEADEPSFLEFQVPNGFVLSIPPFWWYSIQIDDKNTVACLYYYKTVMNVVMHVPEMANEWLQGIMAGKGEGEESEDEEEGGDGAPKTATAPILRPKKLSKTLKTSGDPSNLPMQPPVINVQQMKPMEEHKPIVKEPPFSQQQEQPIITQ